MKFKKAQGLPMNTIVIAAIVLIVLVVIIMIFTGGIGTWRIGVDEAQQAFEESCLGQGGRLVEKENLPQTYAIIDANDADPDNDLFCIK